MMGEQSHDYSTLFGHVPAAIAVIETLGEKDCGGLDFIFRYMNKSCEELEGFTLEDAKGKTFYTLFPLEDRSLAEKYAETASGGRKNIINIARPETEKYLHIECSMLEPGVCVCILFDMTERMPGRRTAQETSPSVLSDMLLQAAYDAYEMNVTKDSVKALKDPDQILADEGAAYTMGEFFEKSLDRISDPVSLIKFEEIFSRTALIEQFGKGVTSFETNCRCRALRGESKWLLMKILLAQDREDGDIIAVAYSKDISEKKLDEIAVQAALGRTCRIMARISVKTGRFTVVFKSHGSCPFPEKGLDFDVIAPMLTGAADAGSDEAANVLSVKTITQNLILKDIYTFTCGRKSIHSQELHFFYTDRSKKDICMLCGSAWPDMLTDA